MNTGISILALSTGFLVTVVVVKGFDRMTKNNVFTADKTKLTWILAVVIAIILASISAGFETMQ